MVHFCVSIYVSLTCANANCSYSLIIPCSCIINPFWPSVTVKIELFFRLPVWSLLHEPYLLHVDPSSWFAMYWCILDLSSVKPQLNVALRMVRNRLCLLQPPLSEIWRAIDLVCSSPHPVKPLNSTASQSDKKEGRSVLEKLKSTIHPGRMVSQSAAEPERRQVICSNKTTPKSWCFKPSQVSVSTERAHFLVHN